MLRSKSTSHIPVRLFGASSASASASGGSKENVKTRSNSAARCSRDSTNLLKPKRNSSLDRKPQSVKQTPLCRKRSVQRMTPSSARSNCSSRISPGSGLKERKTIQKLSSDKKWVAVQFAKVQHFITNSDLFDPTIVTFKNIKPPTFKVFIYIVTVLLKQLFPSIKLSMENFKEELQRKLKAMHYPGTLTNSTLKTVNTMHSWPQVIGMLGWLVDKVTLVNRCTLDYSVLPQEEQRKYLLAQLCTDYILERYNHFNRRDESPEVVEEIDQRFASSFANILGINTDTYQQINAEYYEKVEYKIALQKEVDELSELKKSLERGKNEILETVANLEEEDAAKDAALEADLQHYTSVLNKLTLKENELTTSINKLEESIKVQPCTYREKNNLLQKIKMLKNEIAIFKEKMKHAQAIKDEYDVKIDEEREKLQTKVIFWNRSLMAICIKKPHFKNLLLKETGLHRKEFLEEIREMSKRKVEMENEIRREIDAMEISLAESNDIISSLKEKLKDVQDDINKMTLESKQLNENAAALDQDTKQKLAAWELQKQTLLSAMENPEEMEELRMLVEENKQLFQTRNQLQKELDEFKLTALTFFVDLDKQVSTNILEMNKILEGVSNQIEEAVLRSLQERNNFNAFLEGLTNEK